MPKLAVVQMDAVTGDKAANLARAAQWIGEAAAGGADFVLLPELFVTGYRLDEGFAGAAEPLDGATVQTLHALARRHGLWIAGSLPEVIPDRQRPYNTLAVVSPEGLVAAYRKCHLWGAECRFFSPGAATAVAQTPLGPAGLLICYDISFPEMARSVALQGARLLLYALAFGPESRSHVLRAFAQARAAENLAYVAVANRVGEERGTRFAGGSAVIGPDGLVRCAVPGGEGVAIADVEPDLPDRLRERYPYFRDRRADVYRLAPVPGAVLSSPRE